jgi:predicted acetyltransferase
MSQITYHLVSLTEIHTLVENRIAFALELTGSKPQEEVNALKNQLTDYFTKATKDKSCISYISKYDGKVAGIGSIHIREMPGNFKNPSGKWGYIMNMYTLPEFRRKGICSGILNALIESATQSGITAFELHATKEGELVYKKNGFENHIEPSLRRYILAPNGNY